MGPPLMGKGSIFQITPSPAPPNLFPFSSHDACWVLPNRTKIIQKSDLSSSWKNLAALGFTLHKVLVGCLRELAHI